MCYYPTLRENPKYKPNKKNGGTIPTVLDVRALYIPTGCGNCEQCRKQKAREWNIRLQQEIKKRQTMKFITLTFSNESIKKLTEEIRTKCNGEIWILENTRVVEDVKERQKQVARLKAKTYGYGLDNEICTVAVKRFRERWRKEFKKSIRHWLITELGHNGTENVHIHGILWTENIEAVEKHWQYGWICKGKWENGKLVNYVNERTINYITKYVTKLDPNHKYYKPIILTSAGIGNNYKNSAESNINKFNGDKTVETYRTSNGKQTALPKYFRNTIYNDEEKERLWLQQLDRGIRYIKGAKFDTKTEQGWTAYMRTLKQAQKENGELGYGNNHNSWKEKYYEIQHRILMQNKRLK